MAKIGYLKLRQFFDFVRKTIGHHKEVYPQGPAGNLRAQRSQYRRKLKAGLFSKVEAECRHTRMNSVVPRG